MPGFKWTHSQFRNVIKHFRCENISELHIGVTELMEEYGVPLHIGRIEITFDAQKALPMHHVLYAMKEHDREGSTREEITCCNEYCNLTVVVWKRNSTNPYTKSQMDNLQTFIDILNVYLYLYYFKAQMEHAETHDLDSGVLNINGFVQFGNELIEKKISGQYTALYINISNFNLINRIFGRTGGNDAICQFAQSAASMLEEEETIAHFGGDNFAALVRTAHLSDYLKEFSSFPIYFKSDGNSLKEYRISIHAGLYQLDGSESSMNLIMEYISSAYSLSRKGDIKKQFVFFDNAMNKQMLRENALEQLKEHALKKGEFVVFYQPKVSLIDYSLMGAEALVRWKQKDKILPPFDFVPLFEKNGFICKIDFFVLGRVCQSIRRWLQAGIQPPCISVNFSKQHLANVHIADKIIHVIDNYNVPHHMIEVEFTETAYNEQYDDLKNAIQTLRQAGVRTSMDDFGTGYSSLNLLQDIEFDVLKLDKSFLADYMEQKRNSVILRHIVEMAHELNTEVICEGVENVHHVEFLQSINCYMAQGFLFDRPIQQSQFEKRLLDPIYHIPNLK